MPIQFAKATKTRAKLRMAIDGPSGSGKTYTALIAAMALKNGGRVAVIDTERGSASKYADLFDFDVLDMREAYPRDTFDPLHYIEAITAAEAAGYDVLVIDSLSHAWEGEGGVLEMHDDASRKSGNSYTAWKDVSPVQRKLVDAMLNSGCHVIATMRSKMEYILVKNDKGREEPKKVGMAPIQRQGMEYEFDIVADMDLDHNMIVSKSRCSVVADKVVAKPTAEFFQVIKAWLSDGAAKIVQPPVQSAAPAQPQAQGTLAAHWTKYAVERDAFGAWREKHTLSDSDCKRLAGAYDGKPPLKLFSEFPGTREELQNAIEAQMAREHAPMAVDEYESDVTKLSV